MTVQAITLNLPETLYNQIKQAAEKVQRPLDDVLLEAVTALAPVINTAPQEMQSALAHLAYLNDAALWQAARTTMPVELHKRLETLHIHQQQSPLSEEEQKEESSLMQLYRETVLIRAQAAILLKQRDYDISNPKQFEPLK